MSLLGSAVTLINILNLWYCCSQSLTTQLPPSFPHTRSRSFASIPDFFLTRGSLVSDICLSVDLICVQRSDPNKRFLSKTRQSTVLSHSQLLSVQGQKLGSQSLTSHTPSFQSSSSCISTIYLSFFLFRETGCCIYIIFVCDELFQLFLI